MAERSSAKGRLGAGLAVGLDEPRRIGVRACGGLVDVGGGRGGVLAERDQVEVALLGVGADEQVDVGGEAGGDGCGGLGVEDQAEGAEADQRVAVGLGPQVDARELGDRLDELLVGDAGEGVDVGLDAQGPGRGLGDAGGLLEGVNAPRPLPLCTIARRNRPAASGVARTPPTVVAPADWPKRVTLCGSPPKARYSPHPAQRGDDVEQAAVGGRPGDVEEPGDAEPVVEG